MRWRLLALAGAGLLACVCAGGVLAFWTSPVSTGSNGQATGGTLPAGTTPAVVLAGRTATLSWTDVTVDGSALSGLPGGGYAVTRYAASAPATPIAPGSSCDTTIAGTTCVESGLPTGRWSWSTTPQLGTWSGVEGSQSPTVTVSPDAPVSVSLTNGGGTGNAYINAANASSLSFNVVLTATSLASDTVTLTLSDGSTVVTAAAAGITGGGTRSFAGVDASALADGSITVSAAVSSSYGDTSASTSITRTKDTVKPTLVTLTMLDNNANGKVDRATAVFSETLAAYSAGTAPWTLANTPSGGTLASVAVAAATATLTITEGAGAPDSSVGSFTIALATNATGIRDAAGNLSSFAATTPLDGAKPVLVANTLLMKDVDANGKIDQVSATFSEPLAASSDTTPWTLTNTPSAGTLASVSTSGATATLTITEGAGAANTAVGTFRVVLAASATGIRDAAGNQASLASTAPVDAAAPVLVTLTMLDNNANGKIDRATALFSEALVASTNTAPWTLANTPSGGTLASVSNGASTATLIITEGAGAQDTSVGSFTIALTTNATGIRDAAGNLSSFAATTPLDGAKPVLVTNTLQMFDTDANAKIDQVTADFSETLAAYSAGTTPWTLANVPSAGTLASVNVSGATATLTITEGAGAANTAVGTFTVALAANATGIRDAAGNLSTLAATAPLDKAKPILLTLTMKDANTNGKIDQATALFSETLAAYSAGTAPWTLTNTPSGGTLASAAVAAATATLTITEGAAAQDTSVGSFTIALTTNATGIRDAAGNLSSFATTTPLDGAKPVLVTNTLQMFDTDANAKIDQVTADFSETLAAYSAGTTPWTLANVPSAGSLSSVSTSGATATLTLNEGAGAANTAVGTFTVALAANATGIRDAAGNLSTLAATAPLDKAKPILLTLTMKDANTNGKIDQATALFSETLAAYSAGTAPWTLANTPSGGTLASVAVAAATATLTITEGAGAPDSSVGSFTIALATNATGIRDAAGNLSSFAATTPLDGAKPVLVANTLLMKDVDANGKIDQVSATFSEPLAASSDTTPWTLTNTPSAGTLASVSTSGATATLTITEGAGAANTAVGTFRVVLAASATGIRDAAGNQASLASTAPVDAAAPVLVTLTMLDNNANGKIDRATALFSEALVASTNTAPWTLANTPSGGTLASVSNGASTATLIITEGAGAQDTSVGSFTIALTTNATGIRDAAGNLSSFAATTPLDGAKPVLVTNTLQMFDTDANAKIDQVTADFSETLAAYSAGTTPWTLANVPSAGTLASVNVSGATATLTITEGAGAANTAVGTFTVALAANATGIRDAAGNLSTLAATAPLDKAKPILLTLTMKDANTNGKIDQATALFSETLAAYSAGTAPWTLTNTPSGGTLASAAVAAATATLTITEGAAAQDTSVGSFTIALTTNATGIRDAAGNLSSFATTTPLDGAKPVPVSVTSSNLGATLGLMEAGDTLTVTFSEPIATSVGPSATITETDPNGAGNDTLLITGLTAAAGVSTGSNGYIATNNTSASFTSSALSGSGATITATVGGSCSGTCGANITASSGALVFAPDVTLADAAGNTAAGTLTTAAGFRLF